jgi:hypothetical protein
VLGECQLRAWLAGFLGLVLQASPSAGQEVFGPFLIYPSQPDAIVLADAIDERSPLEFRRALKAHPSVKVLALHSPGGLVASSLLIADEVHERKLATFIPTGSVCASACALIYLAGDLRVVEGKLGVHQIYGDRPDMVATQLTISDIVEALSRYKTPSEVLAIMLRTPPDQMYFFSPDEVAKYGLNRTAVSPNVNTDDGANASLTPPRNYSSEQRALAFLSDVLDAHSTATAAAVEKVAHYYANDLTYFGRPTTLTSVLTDKRAYFARWPNRTVRVKPETLRVTCYSDLCDIMGEYDWSVSAGSENKAGVALFHYEFRMGDRLKIVTEGGQVLR